MRSDGAGAVDGVNRGGCARRLDAHVGVGLGRRPAVRGSQHRCGAARQQRLPARPDQGPRNPGLLRGQDDGHGARDRRATAPSVRRLRWRRRLPQPRPAAEPRRAGAVRALRPLPRQQLEVRDQDLHAAGAGGHADADPRRRGRSPADAAADRAGGPRRRHLPGHDRLQRHELVGAPRRPRVSRQRPRRRLHRRRPGGQDARQREVRLGGHEADQSEGPLHARARCTSRCAGDRGVHRPRLPLQAGAQDDRQVRRGLAHQALQGPPPPARHPGGGLRGGART